MISRRIPISKAFRTRGNVHHRAVVALPMLNLWLRKVNLVLHHSQIPPSNVICAFQSSFAFIYTIIAELWWFHEIRGFGLSLVGSFSLHGSCCLGFGGNFLDDSVAEVEDLRLFLMLLPTLLPTMELLSTVTSFGWCMALLASETHWHLKHSSNYIARLSFGEKLSGMHVIVLLLLNRGMRKSNTCTC